jgi:hypothetical protein
VPIAVGDPNKQKSAIWNIFSVRNDVYATQRSMAGIEKISFHASSFCRRAFVASRRLPSRMTDRVIERWRRDETPPAGEHQAVALLTIFLPGNHLSPDLATSPKEVIWLGAPPQNFVRIVQLLLPNETASTVEQRVALLKQLVVSHALPDGQNVILILG